jgi:DNA polymerase III delta prime subunit
MEQFADNCRFILTCNFKEKILAPLHSRCAVYEFTPTGKDKASLAGQFHKRAKDILEIEKITYEEKTVADLILKHAPDWRRILNELQRTSVVGEVSDGTITSTMSSTKQLLEFIKEKNFKKTRQWVTNNMDAEPSAIFRGIYDDMFGVVKNSSIPQLIVTLAEYQYKAAFVADQEVNTMACMMEIMSEVEFQ